MINEEFKYNIHWLLYDLFRIKCKFLCKKGYHLMALSRKVIDCEPIIIEKGIDYIVTSYPKQDITYRKCLCCNKISDWSIEYDR